MESRLTFSGKIATMLLAIVFAFSMAPRVSFAEPAEVSGEADSAKVAQEGETDNESEGEAEEDGEGADLQTNDDESEGVDDEVPVADVQEEATDEATEADDTPAADELVEATEDNAEQVQSAADASSEAAQDPDDAASEGAPAADEAEVALATSALSAQAADDGTGKASGSSASALSKQAASSTAGNPQLRWANNEEDAQKWFDDADVALENGTAELVRIEYDDENGKEVDLDADDLESASTSDDAYYADGVLCAPAGATVYMTILPDFGYQLLDDAVSDGAITLAPEGGDSDVGLYAFEMPDDDVTDLDIDFRTAEDSVDVNSSALSKATITRGEDDAVENGTLRLNVDDITDADAKADLDDNAKNGKIVAYLDLSMYNVINQADDNDAWETQVDVLDNAVVLNFTLSDDIANDSATSYYVLREHDGEFQQAPADYDSNTQTISFKSNAYSNYAIVEGPSDGSSGSSASADKSGSSASASKSSSSASASKSSSSKATPAAGDVTDVLPLGALALSAAAVASMAIRRSHAGKAE